MWQVARRINKKRGRKKSWYRGHAMLKSKQGFNHFEKKESKMEWHVYIQARWEKEKKKKRNVNVFKRPKWPIGPNKRLHLSIVSSLRTTNQNKINTTQ